MGFTHKYPYTNVSELNLDWVLDELAKFRTELETIAEGIFEEVMADVQPQLDSMLLTVTTLQNGFNAFKTEIRNSQLAFEQSVNQQISDLETEFERVKDELDVKLEQVKIYSDIQNENLYNQILEELAQGIVNIKVINYITGTEMTIQDMFNYLCIFHLQNPISYTQLALKNKTYTQLTALNLTNTDLIMNGNILIV